MTTYLTAVVPLGLEERFRGWLSPHVPVAGGEGGIGRSGAAGSGEYLVVDLPGTGARLHHVGRSATADLLPAQSGPAPSGALFRGYAQSPGGDTLVFGGAGAAALATEDPGAIHGTESGLVGGRPGREWDGTHLAVAWTPEGLTAHTDFSRMLPLLYTWGGGLLALSDSWQLLVRLRRAMGLPVSINTQTVCAMATERAITEHPLDTGTACTQVRMATVGSHVSVRWTPVGAGEPRIDQAPFPEIFAEPPGNWADTVRQGAVTMASVLRAWRDLPGGSLRLSMSGGADSRAVLAAARRADPEQQATTLTTAAPAAATARDHEVVQGLARAAGLRLGNNPAAPAPQLHRYRNRFLVWMTGSLGLHDRLQLPSPRVGTPGHYTLTGHGAGLFKGTYGWRPFTEVAAGLERWDPGVGAVAGRLGEGYLRSVGVDPEAPDASEWHYIGLRNSLHGGRFTLSTYFGSPPLMQRDLARLAHVPAGSSRSLPAALRRSPESNAPRLNTSISTVLTVLLDPELAALPYDAPEKDLDHDTLDTILGIAGGPLSDDELASVAAYGIPADVDHGAAETFQSLSRTWGQTVDADRDSVAPLVAQGGAIAADAGLAEWYGPLAEDAAALLQEDVPLAHQRGSFGRLMTFLPLADAPLDGPVPPRTVAPPARTVARPAAVLAKPARAGRRAARFARRAAGRLVRGLRGRG
ncbi:MAG: hypothetical protein QJR09_01505 [Micrococcus sp.]|nr:hypothetical protein [Micrococcus sp.]